MTGYFLLVELYLLQLVLEVKHFGTDLALCCFKYIQRKTYLGSNLECKRASRMPHRETIKRHHTFGVEQHSAIKNALIAVGQQFEVCEVGRNHAKRVTTVQFFQQRFGNGAARAWLRAATQLVKEE